MSQPSQHSPLVLATTVILGVLSTSFSAIFLNIALPTMIEQLNIADGQSHWLISVFITTSTLFMLLVSSLISHFSLRTTFISFLLIFICASMIGGNLTHYWLIIACRAAQGAAMGVLSVVALITLFDAYPIERRGRAGAVFGLGVAMGPTLGPTLSGFIVEYWGWQGTFFCPVILAVVSLCLSWKVLPSKVISNKKIFDKWGFALLTIILFSMLGGVSYLQQLHWPSSETALLVIGLCAAIIILWHHQKRCVQPLLSLSLFQYPAFNAAAIVSFVYGMGLWGSAFFLPLYLQQAIHYSAQDTGMVMLPSGLLLCLIMPLGGRMADRLSARLVVALGLLALGSSFILMGLGVAHASFIILAVLIALSRGLGLGIMIPSLDATGTRALPSKDLTDGVAMMNFLRQLGGALSPTLLMMLLHWRLTVNKLGDLSTEQATLISYQESLLGLGSLFLLSLLAAWHLRTTK